MTLKYRSRRASLLKNELLFKRFSLFTKLFFTSVRCCDQVSRSSIVTPKRRVCFTQSIRSFPILTDVTDNSCFSKTFNLDTLYSEIYLQESHIHVNDAIARFDIACIITIIIVQTIVNVGLLFAWSCMLLVEDMMNTLDGCNLLGKVVNLTNEKPTDVTVPIKLQQFRSRYVEYFYYNCTRVLCECHGKKMIFF